ncbi:HlyD family secretion protein [Mannheimia varigena]|uniref:HlyD family secretion protein n=1 Tax=Mannheimia varigena TaxID=85404 RepID=UPI0015B6DDDE|nr:HlyD family secretion protein [Mannheimia varigena]QLD32301.1 HlyD family secretion protein [Mannheimia varigena]
MTEENQIEATQNQAEQWQPKKASLLKSLLVLILIAAGVLGILYAWKLPPFQTSLVETNNAYVRGKTTLVSSKIGGYVKEVPVSDYQIVEAGQVIARIDPTTYLAQVEQAKANLATQEANLSKITQSREATRATVGLHQASIESAEATIHNAQLEFKRQAELIKTNSTSKQQYDAAVANLKKAQAALNQAKAQKQVANQEVVNVSANEKAALAAVENAKAGLILAEDNLAHTEIKAPVAGKLGEIGVKQGQLLNAGGNLAYLVPPQTWVIANLKETEMENIRLGQTATIKVDALNKAELTGKVVEISPATGSEFSLNKTDNSTGNFVKIPQRIPVKIEIDQSQENAKRLLAGMSVVVAIETAE